MSQKNESQKLAPDGGGGGPEADRLLAIDAAAALNGPVVETQALKGRITVPLLMSVAAAAGGSSFIFGYNIGVINAPGDVIKDWEKGSYDNLHGATIKFDENGTEIGRGLTKEQVDTLWSWTVSVFALGGAIGGLLCGYAADRFGRKGAMMMNNVLLFAAAIIMACSKPANAYPMLILGRFIVGLNCGLNSGLAPMYLTEIAPVNYRGMLGSVNQLMVTVAILIANILGLKYVFGTAELWPLLFVFMIGVGFFQLCLFPFCPESPKYLAIIKRQPQEAEKALKRLRQKVDVSAELKATQDEGDKIANAPKVKFGDMFKNPVLRWALLIAVMMMFAQQLSGINAAMFFSSKIFKDYAKMSADGASGATLGMCLINVIMTVVSTAMVDRMGRRILMLIGMAGMWVTSILIVICLVLLQQNKEKFGGASYPSMVFVFFFVISFATGPGSIPWFYVSELFDQGARGNANAVAVMTNWMASFLVGVAFLPWQNEVGGYSFLAFTGFLTFFWLFTFFFAPETKGRQLEDIEEELRAKAPCNRKR